MTIQTLLNNIKNKSIHGSDAGEIVDVHSDSRKIQPGWMFIAVRGTQSDGHDYIASAVEKGAAAVVCETLPDMLSDAVCYIKVDDSAEALGIIASNRFGNPSAKLKLVGVTGTNGKTTTVTLLYHLFRQFGHKVGLLSTVCNYVDDKPFEATHTTPDPIALNELMKKMTDAGCEYAFMEVSSHAVDQKRIAGLKFAGAVFSNITRDHLDYHKTFEVYLKAKKAFFDRLPREAFALTNLDDKNGLVMLQNSKAQKYTYSLHTLADFKGRILENHFEGMLLEINKREVAVHFIGKFNAYNLLAVFGTACLLGKNEEEVLVRLSTLKPVAGRFEPIRSPQGFTAIVDYAHTPDALTNVLTGIHQVMDGKGKLITVVGAGGNRDKGKRPLMAQEAAKYSDTLILTSDNPRFEEPEAIIADMYDGLDTVQRKKTLTITDRKEAIKTAVMLARKDDIILIAGKGHENYQEVKGVKHHFDDKEVVKAIFES
ncbi:MAG: UDP-N-acetylmuramoyl-L-alanyl-D-glutamate--2,6-diaminopimelate ligase [Candidatus Azobacteroides sp.]|nr:UDP-N-acetylmuramoyl-L-alanyl-D-glutamate--2,6-diaminopimelate ligase [Candidatus Azobacteroides sp.]